MPFQPGYFCPLKDARRFDDELGSGYAHAALANRDPIDPECRVHDAWIVNGAAMIHPGLSVSSVPVRLRDVNEVTGLPMDVDLSHPLQPA